MDYFDFVNSLVCIEKKEKNGHFKYLLWSSKEKEKSHRFWRICASFKSKWGTELSFCGVNGLFRKSFHTKRMNECGFPGYKLETTDMNDLTFLYFPTTSPESKRISFFQKWFIINRYLFRPVYLKWSSESRSKQIKSISHAEQSKHNQNHQTK